MECDRLAAERLGVIAQLGRPAKTRIRLGIEVFSAGIANQLVLPASRKGAENGVNINVEWRSGVGSGRLLARNLHTPMGMNKKVYR